MRTEGKEDEEEETVDCNPMVSDAEEEEDADEVLRGDRVGSTTYSERHLIQSLMNWTQELRVPFTSSQSSEESQTDSQQSKEEEKERKIKFLEEMAILWDMSAENDVAVFLVEKGAFELVAQTLIIGKSKRFKEIALGIFANLLSSLDVLVNFPSKDEELNLVELTVTEALNCSTVPLFLQIFSVLQRILWCIKSQQAKIRDQWLDSIMTNAFFDVINFLLASSKNALLLKEVITTCLTILEILSPEESEENVGSFENYELFCETPFVPSLCEGLNEILNVHLLKAMSNVVLTGGDVDELYRASPEKLKLAINQGISSFSYLKKTQNGMKSLVKENKEVLQFIKSYQIGFWNALNIEEKDDNEESFEIFSFSLDLLRTLHLELESFDGELLLHEIKTMDEIQEQVFKDPGKIPCTNTTKHILKNSRANFKSYCEKLKAKFGENIFKGEKFKNLELHFK